MGTVKTNSGEIKDSLAGFDGKTADVIGPIDIFRATGETVQFKDLWDQNEGMAVVALLRHFGCICSWELASKLKDSKTQLDSAGVKLIAVGVGTLTKPVSLPISYPFQWIVSMQTPTVRHIMLWTCTMVGAAHSSILLLPKRS